MFYKLDSTRVSLREYWWGTPNPLVVFGWLAKLLRIRLPGSVDDPNVDTLEPFRISPKQLPEDVRGKFHAAHEELRSLGFHSPVCYRIHDVRHQTDIYQAVYLHNSGQALARVHYRVWHFPKPPKEYFFPVFLTRFTDSTYLISTAGKRDMLAPPACRENRHVAATATDLWKSHQDALQESLLFKTVYPVQDEEELRDAIETHHAAVRDFNVERGVFVPLGEEEEQAVVEAAQAAVGAESEGETPSQFPAILDEIEKLQNKRSGWGTGVIVLIVSVGLFLALGAARWSWGFVAMLLPILFFHELGHYAAMRLFRYSNVKMFFIPLLGAAVSGRHYNVPGWKKVVVSLAGPLPGILLGTGLGIYATWFQIDWLQQVAMLTIFLNGFNLLPILPLDGGWVVHSLLFSRHYILDAGFRVVAVATLLASSFLIGDNFLFFFGLVMAAGLPVAFRMAGVVSAVRGKGISTASSDDQTIPPETADVIADEIRSRFPQALSNKHVAQFTLQAFEALNARPPGILATILLGGVFVGSFLFGLAAVAVLAVGLPFLMGADFAPIHPVEVEQIEIAGADRGGELPDEEVTMVATFSTAEEAAAQFAGLQGRRPEDAVLVRFGRSVLLAVPRDGETTPDDWEAEFRSQTPDVLDSTDCSMVGFSLVAAAPSEDRAVEIEQTLKNHFAGGMQALLTPPWHPDQPPTPEQQKARNLHARLLVSDFVYEDPRYLKILREVEKVDEEDDQRAAELQKDLHAVRSLIIEERLQRMLDDSDNPLERELIELHRQQPVFESEVDEPSQPGQPMPEAMRLAREKASEEFQEQYDSWRGRVVVLLGALPTKDGQIVSGASRYSLDDCMITRTGTSLEFSYVIAERPVDGIPALVRWLAEQGCTEMKYIFFGDD